MKYEIIWSNFAEHQLDLIYNYYAEKVNVRVAKNIIFQISDKVEILITNPLIGKKENYLLDRKEGYRHLIIANYKIIYSVNEALALVKISDVFDTRQNPVKLKRN